MTGPTQTFQLSVEAAEAYEARFVPALFAEWAPQLVEAAGVGPGQAVLDVACGTGVVARAAADRMGGRGRVAGADLNEGMLAVARRLRPDLEWHRAEAADAWPGFGCRARSSPAAATARRSKASSRARDISRARRSTGSSGCACWRPSR